MSRYAIEIRNHFGIRGDHWQRWARVDGLRPARRCVQKLRSAMGERYVVRRRRIGGAL